MSRSNLHLACRNTTLVNVITSLGKQSIHDRAAPVLLGIFQFHQVQAILPVGLHLETIGKISRLYALVNGNIKEGMQILKDYFTFK
jgi:hypothetical protein